MPPGHPVARGLREGYEVADFVVLDVPGHSPAARRSRGIRRSRASGALGFATRSGHAPTLAVILAPGLAARTQAVEVDAG